MSERTERNCNKCIHHTSGDCDSWDCKMQTVEDVKNEAVNEYVKAVVAELEKLQTYNMSLVTLMSDLQKNGVCRHYICLEDAIEIVKHGGVSDDVCEWTLTDTRKVMPYETSCDNEDLYDNSYKYCPYCGKKIKVVVE